MPLLFAFSLQHQVEKYGAYVGLAAFLGLAVLTVLYFAQARELKRLRDWAGRAPERAQELEARVVAQADELRRAQAEAAVAAVSSGNGRGTGTPVPIPMGPRPAVAVAKAQAGGVATEERRAVQPAELQTGGEPPSEDETAVPAETAAAVAGAPAETVSGAPPAEGAPAETAPGSSGETVAAGPPAETVAGAPVAEGPRAEAVAGAPAAEGPRAEAVAEPPAETVGSVPGAEEPPAEGRPVSPGETVAGAPSGAWARAETPPAQPPAADQPGAPAGETADVEPDEVSQGDLAAPASAGNGARTGAPPPIPRATPRPQGQPRPAPAAPLRATTRAATLPPRPGPAAAGRTPSRTARIAVLTLIGVIVLAGAIFGATQLLGGKDEPKTAPNVAQPPSSSASPTAADVTDQRPNTVVTVLNGTATDGLAGAVREKLVAEGYSDEVGMIRTGNNSDQQRQDSVVLYAPGKRRMARDVSQILGIHGRPQAVDEDTLALANNTGDNAAGHETDVVVIAGPDQAP